MSQVTCCSAMQELVRFSNLYHREALPLYYSDRSVLMKKPVSSDVLESVLCCEPFVACLLPG